MTYVCFLPFKSYFCVYILHYMSMFVQTLIKLTELSDFCLNMLNIFIRWSLVFKLNLNTIKGKLRGNQQLRRDSNVLLPGLWRACARSCDAPAACGGWRCRHTAGRWSSPRSSRADIWCVPSETSGVCIRGRSTDRWAAGRSRRRSRVAGLQPEGSKVR